MSLVGVALLHAQVTFRFSGGISNEQLKQNVERNVSALLSEINNAESAGRSLDLAGICGPICASAASGRQMCRTVCVMCRSLRYARFR